MPSDKRDLGGNGTEPGHESGVSADDTLSGAAETLAAESSGGDIDELKRELAAKTAEAAQNYDRFVRECADLDNYKKRAQRERADTLRFGAEQLVRDLLPIIDNLERSIEHAEASGEGDRLIQGVRLVLKSALDVLARHHVTRVEATGKPFDPAFHEAIVQVPSDEMEPNHVVQQFQPGYLLHDRLLRPAQVSVSAPPARKIVG